MIRPKRLYLYYYAAAASLLPFLVLYYEAIGLSGRQVGVLSALLPLMTLLGVPLWSTMADTTQRYRTLMLIAVAGTVVCTLVTPFMTRYLGLLVVIGLLSFFMAPTMPLVDHTTLTLLQHQRRRYGSLRLWGAIGWGIAAPLTGLLTTQAGLRWAFLIAAALLCLLWNSVRRLPKPASERKDQNTLDFRHFVSAAWLGFLLKVFMGGICLVISGNFLYLYMADLGISSTFVGIALTVATVSEIPFFWLSGRLLQRYTARTLLLAALLMFALRLALYAFALEAPFILGIQLLHGATFSLMWVAGVACADGLAPDGMGATAQGLFSATVMGLGGVVGALVGGVLYDAVGASGMFQWVAVSTLIVSMSFIAPSLYSRRAV